ncbi:MAG: xanthine dehydrogenase family protein subunit M [Nitrososphaerales archaeon]|jgi:aerobic carbon-monoxide dehydrogenase medium subunit
MIPKKFDYHAPASVDEAIRLLGENEEAKILAGGQSLLPIMKLRLAAPTAVVDISRLPGLSYVRDMGAHLAVGALTTHDTLGSDKSVKERFSLITDAVTRIGDQQVRNLGTIGGSACHADPAGDIPTALLAADAQFVIEGKRGKRVVPARDFFVDLFTTAVSHDEMLIEVRLPYFPQRSASAYMKHCVREGGFAIAMVGVVATLEDGNSCRDSRIGVGAAGPTPIRAVSAERYLKGKTLDETTIAEAADRAVDEADPPSDVHGSREYRMEAIKVLTKRSLRLASERAGVLGMRVSE